MGPSRVRHAAEARAPGAGSGAAHLAAPSGRHPRCLDRPRRRPRDRGGGPRALHHPVARRDLGSRPLPPGSSAAARSRRIGLPARPPRTGRHPRDGGELLRQPGALGHRPGDHRRHLDRRSDRPPGRRGVDPVADAAPRPRSGRRAPLRGRLGGHRGRPARGGQGPLPAVPGVAAAGLLPRGGPLRADRRRSHGLRDGAHLRLLPPSVLGPGGTRHLAHRAPGASRQRVDRPARRNLAPPEHRRAPAGPGARQGGADPSRRAEKAVSARYLAD